MHYVQRMISFKTNKDVIIYVPTNYIKYLCTDYLLGLINIRFTCNYKEKYVPCFSRYTYGIHPTKKYLSVNFKF